ncbi:acyl carrier protein [Serratia ficaria]|nr:acyl carrier protein [Serratia ficaria]
MDKQEIFQQIQALLVKLFELNAEDIKPDSRLYEELELDSIDV